MIDPSIRLDRRAASCMQCERPFADGETIVSTIRPGEGEETFVRRDLCEACFDAQGGEAGVHSLWRSRQPERVTDPHRVDFELAGTFLERLLGDADPAQAELAWVLALLLARKRRVKLHERRAEGGTVARIVLPGAEEDLEFEVAVPDVRALDADRLQRELADLFGFAMPGAPEGEPPAADATPPAGGDAPLPPVE